MRREIEIQSVTATAIKYLIRVYTAHLGWSEWNSMTVTPDQWRLKHPNQPPRKGRKFTT